MRARTCARARAEAILCACSLQHPPTPNTHTRSHGTAARARTNPRTLCPARGGGGVSIAWSRAGACRYGGGGASASQRRSWLDAVGGSRRRPLSSPRRVPPRRRQCRPVASPESAHTISHVPPPPLPSPHLPLRTCRWSGPARPPAAPSPPVPALRPPSRPPLSKPLPSSQPL